MRTLRYPRLPTKSFLKWVGSKRQLLPELVKYVPKKYNVYIEPFVGGGSLFFHLRPKHARLADSNVRLMRTYKAVRDDVKGVIGTLRDCYKYDKTFFYETRARDIDKASDVEVAAWFIFLNKCGFNGLYRVNQKNECNVPFGKYTDPLIADAVTLRACSEALQDAELGIGADFMETAAYGLRGDFMYFDPPYVPLTRTSDFTSYTAGGFGALQHARLRETAEHMKRIGVQVLLSNSSADYVKELYRGGIFELIEVDASRSINSKGDARGNVKELIIR